MENLFSAVLTFPDSCSRADGEGRYRVTILRPNGIIASTGRSFDTRAEARIFVEGLDMMAQLMSKETRVLLDELTAEESLDFELAGKVGALTAPQVVALQAIKAGDPYVGCTTPGQFTRRSRVLDRMIDRKYASCSRQPSDPIEKATFFLTPAGEKSLFNATADDADAAVGMG